MSGARMGTEFGRETMATVAGQIDNYLEAYGELRGAGRREPEWLKNLRDEAWELFREKGFPTTHDEDWRFTSVAALARTPFRRAAATAATVSRERIETYGIDGSACRLVFVNGFFAPLISDARSLPAGLEICSLARALDCGMEGCAPSGIEQQLGGYADMGRDVFVALNTALWEDGAYVRVRRGAAIGQPVHLLYVTAGCDRPTMTYPRTLVIVEEASRVAVVEEYISLGAGAGMCNSVTELVAGQDAAVSHYLMERENLASFNFSTLRAELGRGARLASHSMLLGGGLVRNNVHPVLAGEGAECLINGLFAGEGRQHLDNYMFVEHAKPHGSSRQFYNGILDEQAHGVFHGRIVVRQDAQKTDAKQTNRNLLLSDDARIDTKPQLEIHADDVKCTHGATIGQIEEEPLFYLRSRGLDEVAARNLLLYAFAAECLDRMQEAPVRKFAEALIQERLLEVARRTRPATKLERQDENAPNWEEVG
jgi:Fe-S cluster assembly protein SufD